MILNLGDLGYLSTTQRSALMQAQSTLQAAIAKAQSAKPGWLTQAFDWTIGADSANAGISSDIHSMQTYLQVMKDNITKWEGSNDAVSDERIADQIRSAGEVANIDTLLQVANQLSPVTAVKQTAAGTFNDLLAGIKKYAPWAIGALVLIYLGPSIYRAWKPRK